MTESTPVQSPENPTTQSPVQPTTHEQRVEFYLESIASSVRMVAAVVVICFIFAIIGALVMMGLALER